MVNARTESTAHLPRPSLATNDSARLQQWERLTPKDYPKGLKLKDKGFIEALAKERGFKYIVKTSPLPLPRH